MQHLIEHARSFPHTAQQTEEFRRLATGQSPHALFITCSDSRVVPSPITGARIRGEDLSSMLAVAGWLGSQLPDRLGELHKDQGVAVAAAVQRTIRDQLERLRDYPCVAERSDAGQLRLHGWFYAVDTGLVPAYQPSVDAFLPL